MAEPIPQPELEGLTELEDGSVLVEGLPEAEEAESSFSANLAETLDTFTLNTIATSLLELIEKDEEARKERDKQQEEGIRRTGLGDDAPGGATFDGASKVVHPALAEGCVDFSARAIKELFPANGPVRTRVNGQDNESLLDKARRKRDFLNFYITRRMPEYRAEKEILLTQLPLGGSQYEKYWFDGKRVRMEFVPIDKVYLPYSANSFYTSPRITHVRELTAEKVKEHVDSGFYTDVFGITEQQIERSDSEKANEKIEGKDESGYNEDGLRVIYEVTCKWDVDEENGPFVVHIDASSKQICAIYRNWREGDKTQEALEWWVEDKFIPWRGAYGIGLPHLIGGLSAALTGALRALLDSAHINNAPTAIKLKSGRASGQTASLEMTAVTEIDAPAGTDDIRKVMMPVPFNPPSAVLFQLLDWITAQAKGVVATAEERIADAGSQMPVGTALALIEQGSQVFSSIHARLHDSQRRALNIICRLVADYPEHALADMAKYGLTPQDFIDSDDIEPVSDPNIFSETQRFAQMQSVMQLAAGDAQNPAIPWNPLAIRRRMLELLRVENIDELLPKPPQPLTADPVAENIAVMSGQQIKPVLQQDHQAHIQAHLLFIFQPMIKDGPIPGQNLSLLIAHINEHMVLAYQHTVMSAQLMIQAEQPEMSPDQLAMVAALKATDSMAQWQAKIAQELQQAQQIVQSKMPPPPVDPAIQKTFEAAMAEVQRKTAVDQAENARKDRQQQFEQQNVQTEQMLDQIQRGIEMKLEKDRMAHEESLAKLTQQVELMKNDQDNQIHQMTELLKNRDDNETKMQIAQLQGQLSSMSEAMSQPVEIPAPDFSPMLKEMQAMLGQIEKARTDDALGAVVGGLKEVITQLNAPVEFVRDPKSGKALGARKVRG